MNASRLGTLDVEEQAAHWLRVMESPSPNDRAKFWAWIQSSPTHVRELLLASKLDQELDSIDRGRRIDVETLIFNALAQEEARRAAARMARARLRQAPHWFTGIAASIAFVAVAAFLIPTVSGLRSTHAEGDTLGRIVAEFNRNHATPRLHVEGETLRNRRFTVVFDAHDPGSLLDYLARDEGVIVVNEGDDIVIRLRDAQSFRTSSRQ